MHKTPLDQARGYEIKWQQVAAVFNAGARIANCTYVYLIGEEDEGPFKIGKAKNPISRLRTMQTGNPRRLCVEYVLIGGLATEKLLHEYWEPFAIRSKAAGVDSAPRTEWFRPEARNLLSPLIEEAARRQVESVPDVGDIYEENLQRAVRDAHKAIVINQRDEPRMLAAVMGYTQNRSTRI